MEPKRERARERERQTEMDREFSLGILGTIEFLLFFESRVIPQIPTVFRRLPA